MYAYSWYMSRRGASGGAVAAAAGLGEAVIEHWLEAVVMEQCGGGVGCSTSAAVKGHASMSREACDGTRESRTHKKGTHKLTVGQYVGCCDPCHIHTPRQSHMTQDISRADNTV